MMVAFRWAPLTDQGPGRLQGKVNCKRLSRGRSLRNVISYKKWSRTKKCTSTKDGSLCEVVAHERLEQISMTEKRKFGVVV